MWQQKKKEDDFSLSIREPPSVCATTTQGTVLASYTSSFPLLFCNYLV